MALLCLSTFGSHGCPFAPVELSVESRCKCKSGCQSVWQEKKAESVEGMRGKHKGMCQPLLSREGERVDKLARGHYTIANTSLLSVGC